MSQSHTYTVIGTHQHIQDAKFQIVETQVLPFLALRRPHLWLRKAGFELRAI